MKTKNKNFGWKILVLWVLVYTTGYVIAGRVATNVINQLGTDPAWMITFPIAGMAYGGVMGLMQWLLLFRYGIPFWWVIASVIGGIPMFFLQEYGFVVGAILQTFILYSRFYWSWLWIFANIPVFFIQNSFFSYFYRHSIIQNIDEAVFASVLVAGLCGGIIMGIALIIILHNPILEDQYPPSLA